MNIKRRVNWGKYAKNKLMTTSFVTIENHLFSITEPIQDTPFLLQNSCMLPMYQVYGLSLFLSMKVPYLLKKKKTVSRCTSDKL